MGVVKCAALKGECSTQRDINGLATECARGIITERPLIAGLAHTANSHFKGGSGGDGTINRVAGPVRVSAKRALGRIEAD